MHVTGRAFVCFRGLTSGVPGKFDVLMRTCLRGKSGAYSFQESLKHPLSPIALKSLISGGDK